MRVEPRIELDPALVEESVLMATDASSPEARRPYRRERNAVYEIAETEKREAAFQELDARWFGRLGLGSPLSGLLREFDSVLARVSRCLVLPAGRSRDEGADLHDGREAAPTLAVKLTPGSLLDFDRVAPLLRNELLHVEDMLDPDFGYERDPPSVEVDPVYEKLVRDRYRVLWNASVDGRLARRGQLPDGGEARRRREFLATFPVLGTDVERQFERFFHGSRPSHGELLSFARSVEGRAAGRCPLCRFPTARFRGEGEPLDARVEEAIRQDFPEWSSSQGICVQCGDLYEARALSGAPTALHA
ncbi:MAG: hypothetical protein ACRD1Z_14045, partial [Vicinamibacteria bacterium]